MQEELDWIDDVLSGNKEAYRFIIEKYKNPLYATILRMTKHPQDAQDLVQDAFIKIYEQLHKYDRKGKFSSWLYRVAINHCLDEFRKKKYQMKQVEMSDRFFPEVANPEVILLKREENRRIERLLAGLEEDERLIILLKYINELSYEEISEQLSIPLYTVRNKLHRAKLKMRRRGKSIGGFLHDVSER